MTRTLQLVRVPLKFYWDSCSRKLPPESHRQTTRYAWLSLDDPLLLGFLDDAEYYTDPSEIDPELRGLCASAKATVKAIKEAQKAYTENA